MKDLPELERRDSQGPMTERPPFLSKIHSPLLANQWEAHLAAHPDPDFSRYVVRGLKQGFHIGMNGTLELTSASANMQSTKRNKEVIHDRLVTEYRAGRVIGPLPEEVVSQIHVNRFGVIPKKHQPGKWRIIVDLSFPKGHSVNDGIDKDLCSLRYAKVDDAVRVILDMGQGTLLSKFDIENVHRLIPVHPDDRWLLGMQWEDELYVDTALPFGLRSAPKIFNAVADALLWILEQEGAGPIMDYLDDYQLFGLPRPIRARANLEMALHTCAALGVPIAPHKTEGPATTLVFLGIEIDTVNLQIRLPQLKITTAEDRNPEVVP